MMTWASNPNESDKRTASASFWSQDVLTFARGWDFCSERGLLAISESWGIAANIESNLVVFNWQLSRIS